MTERGGGNRQHGRPGLPAGEEGLVTERDEGTGTMIRLVSRPAKEAS
jgi:hypothetical protein